jgi:hypothetical protein
VRPLDGTRGGKGPAGAAHALILHGGHGALLPPVKGLGEVLGGEGRGNRDGSARLRGGEEAKVEALELLLRQVRELGDAVLGARVV